MSDDREQRLVEAIYGEGAAAPEDAAEALRLKAFREGLASRLGDVQPPSEVRARLVAEARARLRARRSPWTVWALRLAPVATVVLVVGVWLTVQPRFDESERATPEQAAARAVDEWAAAKTPAAPAAEPPAPVDLSKAAPAAVVTKPGPVVTAASAGDAPAPEPADTPVAAGQKEEAATRKFDLAPHEGPKATATRLQRARLAKELEALGALKPGAGEGKVADLFSAGTGRGSAPENALVSAELGPRGDSRGLAESGSLGASGGGSVAGGSVGGLGQLGRRGGSPGKGGAGLADDTDARAEGQSSVRPAKARAPVADAGLVAGEDLASVAYRQAAPRRDEVQSAEQEADEAPAEALAEAREATPAAAPTASAMAVATASAPARKPAPDAAVTADPDDGEATEKKAEQAAPAAPKPAAQGWSAPAAPAEPDHDASCLALERALARATTPAARVDAALALADCRKRAGVAGLAKRLLEDLLDDTTLDAPLRERVQDALRRL
jgi:hypothetical protein